MIFLAILFGTYLALLAAGATFTHAADLLAWFAALT